MKLSFGKKITGLAVAGVVLAGAGTVAWADSNGGSTATSAPPSTAPIPAAGAASGKAAGRGLGLLRRADHGDVEIRVKGADGAAAWKTVTFDRGQVSGIAGDHITLARPDGKSVTLAINADTKYPGVTSWQQVDRSKGAIVISENGTATLIIQRPATAPAARAPAA